MALQIFATRDAIASAHKALAAFTHVVFVYSPLSIRPFYLRADQLKIEPVSIWLPWKPESRAALDRWYANGGLLIDRSADLETIDSADVVIYTESSFALNRLARAAAVAREDVVIERPLTWVKHEETVETRTPPVDELRALWTHCAGKRLTDQELADASGTLVSRLQLMRARLKPVEEWEIRPRLAPENAGLLPAWEWIGDGCRASRKSVRLAGHLTAMNELVRLGHVDIAKHHVYPEQEPDWAALERKRVAALENLAAVKALALSLPDHLAA
ncbi:conserved hypothetical protein [Paraburkholderia sacchari]|uniref:hypothetical protein n=1 Tax=Paraburkholderia sacchari TaxID=159450 RepID=UPI0039A52858